MNNPVDKPKASSARDRSSIIDHIYQVAIEPERYENLLDLWDEKIAPYRTAENAGSAGHDAVFRDEELEGHVERAGKVIDRIDDKSPDALLQGIVDNISPSAAMIVTNGSKTAFVNNSAASVFSISKKSDLGVLPLSDEQVEDLRSEILGILRPSELNSTRLLRFKSPTSERVLVFKLKKLDREFGNNDYLLLVSTELAWPDGLTQTMLDAFGLTVTEAEIVRALTEGASLKQIADKRGRSTETVKTQLRSILSKTETHTQAELARVTLGLMDVVVATQADATRKHTTNVSRTLKEKPFISLHTADGRRVDHIVIGSDHGKPIVYFPLDYGLIRFPASAEKFAEENGLKIIVPLRPGYGHTTNVKHRKDVVDTVLSDLELITDYHAAKKFPIIALSNDTFFAYHFYNRHPERVTAILNPGVGLPTFKPQHYERMDKWHRFILANARYAPLMLPYLVRTGFSLAKRIGKRGFVHAVYGASKADCSTFENPEVYEAMITGSEVCLSDWHSAHEAFSNEVIIQQQDWSELVHACNAPIHVWYGHQDPQVPIQTALEMIEAYPQINFHSDPDAGQLIFFKNWQEILKKAETYAFKK